MALESHNMVDISNGRGIFSETDFLYISRDNDVLARHTGRNDRLYEVSVFIIRDF